MLSRWRSPLRCIPRPSKVLLALRRVAEPQGRLHRGSPAGGGSPRSIGGLCAHLSWICCSSSGSSVRKAASSSAARSRPGCRSAAPPRHAGPPIQASRDTLRLDAQGSGDTVRVRRGRAPRRSRAGSACPSSSAGPSWVTASPGRARQVQPVGRAPTRRRDQRP